MIARKHIASADLLQLFTAPQELIPAPGIGKVIVPVSAYARTSNVTVAYTLAGGVFYRLGGNSLSAGGFTGDLLSQSFNGQSLEAPFNADSVDSGTNEFANTPLTLVATTSDPLLGDGDLDVYVVYQIADLF